MKHKGRLFKVSGGLIHQVNEKDLIGVRNPNLYSDDEKKFIKLLSLEHDAKIQPLGSITYKIQKYPSDIDMNQVIKIKNNNFENIVNDLKDIVINILKSPGIYFSDFKAGVDERYPNDRDKYILRWNPNEILKGFKVLDKDRIMTLEEALKMQSVVKLDVIGYSNDRFIEISTFIILEKVNDDGSMEFINIPSDYFEQYISNIKNDIEKFSTPGENFKIFKAIKRLWSLSRVTKDFETLKKLEPLINSDLSLLSQINADLESMGLIIQKYKDIPYDLFKNAVSVIAKKLSTITDIKINQEEMVNHLEKIFKNIDKKNNVKILESFEEMHDYLLEILNKETLKYLEYNKMIPLRV